MENVKIIPNDAIKAPASNHTFVNKSVTGLHKCVFSNYRKTWCRSFE